MTKKITLYQAMKQSGLFTSKKEIIAAANAERVTIDEVVTPALQFQFSPTKRKFCIDGKEISLQQKKRLQKFLKTIKVEKARNLLPLELGEGEKSALSLCKQ
ncbi:MAG: hypothetical protein AABX82_05835, partial [Nanoarchaeota archaeon]